MKKKWIERQQALLDAARAAGRGLTAEEQAEFDALQRQIDAEEPKTPSNDQRSAEEPTEDDSAEEAQRAVAEERKRNSDIVELCRQVGMDPTGYIRDGATLDTVRAAAVDHMIQHGAPVRTGVRDTGRDDFRAAAVDAMLLRAGVPVAHPAESADQFRGMSLRDIAVECMARSGEGTTTSLLRMSKDDL